MNKSLVYFRNSFFSFIESFKFKKNTLYSLFSDFIFYFFLALVTIFLYGQFSDRFIRFTSIDASNMGLFELNALATNFFVQYYSLLFLSLVLFIVVYSGFKSFVWSTLMGLKYNREYSRKFSILSFLWLSLWVGLIFLFRYFLSIENFLILFLLFVLINYFTKLLFISFINNKLNFKKSFENMIDLGFKKFYLFLVPYIFEFIVVVILVLVLFVIIELPILLFLVLSFLSFLSYCAWTRKYFLSIVKDIKL